MNEILQKRIEEAAKRYNVRAYSPFSDPYELSRAFENDCLCFKEGAIIRLENIACIDSHKVWRLSDILSVDSIK